MPLVARCLKISNVKIVFKYTRRVLATRFKVLRRLKISCSGEKVFNITQGKIQCLYIEVQLFLEVYSYKNAYVFNNDFGDILCVNWSACGQYL